MVGIPENLSLGDLAYFKYAPINSVDIERSFSIFKVLIIIIIIIIYNWLITEKVFSLKI